MAPVKLLMMVQCHHRNHKLISFIGAPQGPYINASLCMYGVPFHAFHIGTPYIHRSHINYFSSELHVFNFNLDVHTICCQKTTQCLQGPRYLIMFQSQFVYANILRHKYLFFVLKKFGNFKGKFWHPRTHKSKNVTLFSKANL